MNIKNVLLMACVIIMQVHGMEQLMPAIHQLTLFDQFPIGAYRRELREFVREKEESEKEDLLWIINIIQQHNITLCFSSGMVFKTMYNFTQNSIEFDEYEVQLLGNKYCIPIDMRWADRLAGPLFDMLGTYKGVVESLLSVFSEGMPGQPGDDNWANKIMIIRRAEHVMHNIMIDLLSEVVN